MGHTDLSVRYLVTDNENKQEGLTINEVFRCFEVKSCFLANDAQHID